MDRTSLLAMEHTDNGDSPFNLLVETFKNEGFDLSEFSLDVKASPSEERVLEAIRDEIAQAANLYRSGIDISEAAKSLEKIQIAATNAERASFLLRYDRAKKYNHWIHKIASLSRERFHELKGAKSLVRKPH